MTKIVIGSLVEFVPDEPEVREAKLLDLIEDHMGKDMRAIMAEYICAPERVAELEDEVFSLREKLEDAHEAITGLEEHIEELKWSRS